MPPDHFSGYLTECPEWPGFCPRRRVSCWLPEFPGSGTARGCPESSPLHELEPGSEQICGSVCDGQANHCVPSGFSRQGPAFSDNISGFVNITWGTFSICFSLCFVVNYFRRRQWLCKICFCSLEQSGMFLITLEENSLECYNCLSF